FVAVVDPGVGSPRRGIAVETADYKFVAPDNGVLTAVLREAPAKKMVELTERRYARPTVSRTFEGRDRSAPAAAWLARGSPLSAELPADGVGALFGSTDHLELAAPSSSAADRLALARGATIKITRR